MYHVNFSLDAGIPNQNKPIFMLNQLMTLWSICKNDKDKEIDGNISFYWIPNDERLNSMFLL